MALAARWTRIKELRKKWMETPGVAHVFVGYESYSIPDALDHFEERMETEKNFFPITVLHWPRQEGGSKRDRVGRLEPAIRAGKFFLSKPLQTPSAAQIAMKEQGQEFRIFSPQFRIDQNGRRYSINKIFIEEAHYFPSAEHDDFLDATSRFYDMNARPPFIDNQADCEPQVFSDGS